MNIMNGKCIPRTAPDPLLTLACDILEWIDLLMQTDPMEIAERIVGREELDEDQSCWRKDPVFQEQARRFVVGK